MVYEHEWSTGPSGEHCASIMSLYSRRKITRTAGIKLLVLGTVKNINKISHVKLILFSTNGGFRDHSLAS